MQGRGGPGDKIKGVQISWRVSEASIHREGIFKNNPNAVLGILIGILIGIF